MQLAKQNQENNKIFPALLQLESDVRQSEDLAALHYFIVNETRRLVRYQHAILFKVTKRHPDRFKAVRISGSTLLDRSIPKIHYIERVLDCLSTANPQRDPISITHDQLPHELQRDWQVSTLSFPLCVNLILPDGSLIGALWIEREIAWTEEERFLVKRLASSYAHAWGYFERNRKFDSWFYSKKKLGMISVLLVLLLLIPIEHSTLGFVSVVAKDPLVVTAPIDGVIASIPVEPNQMVSQGQALIRYEDTSYRNEFTIAEQALAVSLAELKKVTQSAFQDEKSKAEIALSKAKVELAAIRRDYAKEMLDHVTLLADKQGLILFNNKLEMIGRPVKIGERLMEIAEVGKLKFRIDLPVENNIDFSVGAPVKIYLDTNPLRSIDAKVTQIGFRAEIIPGGMLVYLIEAESVEEISHLRIGWQGTAKIYGGTVNLFFYLFRRPLAAARQYVGY